MVAEAVSDMYPSDRIADLNSKGITLLKESEFGNGAKIFLEALMLLMSEVKDDERSCPSVQTSIDVLAQDTVVATGVEEKHRGFTTCTEDQHTRQLHGDAAHRTIYSIAIPNRNKQAFTLSNDVYELFDRAIDFQQQSLPDSCSTNLLMIGVLSYNIGLAYHLGGVYLCKSSLFTSALEYYNMAFKILDDMVGNQSTSTGIDIITKLPLLAALNNIGHIHAYQCSYSFAEEYCEEIAFHLESNEYLRCKVFGPEEETEIFIQNACFYPRSEELAAAAA